MPARIGSRASLGDVVADLAVFELVRSPLGLGVVIDDATIHDPAWPAAIEAGSLVLGVGLDPASSAALAVVAGPATAVALKFGGALPPSLVDAADAGGTALLAVPPEMTWSHAHSLVQTAITRAASVEDGVGGVPLGDLFALANAIAAMVGGPVTIEDVRSVVLAYSSPHEGIDEPRRQTVLGRRVPSEWLERLEAAGVFRRLWAGEVVRYEAEPEFDLRPRLAIAVTAGDAVLGTIWVAEGTVPFGHDATEALRGAARIAALHLIRHRAAASFERTSRAEALRSLLERRAPLEAVAHQLRVEPSDRFAVIAFESRSSDEVDVAVQRERTSDLIALYCEAFRRHSAQAQHGPTTYVLLPGVTRPDELRSFAREIVERARVSAQIELRAGIGSVVSGLRDVPRSRTDADRVLRAIAALDTQVADIDDTHELLVAVELRDFLDGRPDLRSRVVDALDAHDASHRTRYVDTLRAYLDASGDLAATARALGVHVNTVRYRMRRVAEIGRVDLKDPARRLVVELDLRFASR